MNVEFALSAVRQILNTFDFDSNVILVNFYTFQNAKCKILHYNIFKTVA